MSQNKQLFLSDLDQQGINSLVSEFDEILPRLKFIPSKIVDFLSCKQESLQKELHEAIKCDFALIEKSKTFDAILDIFGMGYEFSKQKPDFFQVVGAVNPTYKPSLPWGYTLGQIYTEKVEKEFLDLQKSKEKNVTQMHEFKTLLKSNPVKFYVVMKRMMGHTASKRCSELIDMYTMLSLAREFDAEINSYSLDGNSCKKDDNDLSSVRDEIILLIKEYYHNFSEFIHDKSYTEPQDADKLIWTELIDRCNKYKEILISIKFNNANLISNFEQEQKRLLLIEYCNLLESNRYSAIQFLPSTIVNKLQGGASLVRKIGQTKEKYKGFEEYYLENIYSYLSQRKTVTGSDVVDTRPPTNILPPKTLLDLLDS